MSQTHELKIWPQFFTDVDSGAMPFSIRKADRPYAVGDSVHLREWDPKTESYTGHGCYRYVTYILKDFAGIDPGYVILGFDRPPRPVGGAQ